jgi:SPP1 gp7 family putative phage head morphogenesis protein
VTNEQTIDAIIGHQVDMQLYANKVVRDAVGTSNENDDELLALILAALLALEGRAPSPAQIDMALGSAAGVTELTRREVEAALSEDLAGAALVESGFQSQLVPDSEPVVPTVTFQESWMTPLMGATIAETLRQIFNTRSASIRRVVQNGFVSGQTTGQMLTAVKQAMDTARRNLETLARSAVTHVTEYTAAAFYALNNDIVKQLVWLSVLDSRTSPPCIARSGKRYSADAEHRPIGHSYPWGAGPGRLHYNCRSTFAPLVAGEKPPNPDRYADWLKRQTAATQDEVLGPTRGVLYRAGKVPVEGFVNNKGRMLNLEQLRAKYGLPP